jgi:hypothetical protein
MPPQPLNRFMIEDGVMHPPNAIKNSNANTLKLQHVEKKHIWLKMTSSNVTFLRQAASYHKERMIESI